MIEVSEAPRLRPGARPRNGHARHSRLAWKTVANLQHAVLDNRNPFGYVGAFKHGVGQSVAIDIFRKSE
jgi:hypothetical protein